MAPVVSAAGFKRVCPQRLEAYTASAQEQLSHGLSNTIAVWAVPVRNFPGGLPLELLDKLKSLAELAELAAVMKVCGHVPILSIG